MSHLQKTVPYLKGFGMQIYILSLYFLAYSYVFSLHSFVPCFLSFFFVSFCCFIIEIFSIKWHFLALTYTVIILGILRKIHRMEEREDIHYSLSPISNSFISTDIHILLKGRSKVGSIHHTEKYV